MSDLAQQTTAAGGADIANSLSPSLQLQASHSSSLVQVQRKSGQVQAVLSGVTHAAHASCNATSLQIPPAPGALAQA